MSRRRQICTLKALAATGCHWEPGTVGCSKRWHQLDCWTYLDLESEHLASKGFESAPQVQFRRNFVECGRRALPWASALFGRVNVLIISALDL